MLNELVAPDLVFRGAGKGWETPPVQGPELLRSGLGLWWESLPDLYPTVEQLIAEDDKVVVLCTFTATHRRDPPMGPSGPIKATGRRLELPIIYVFRISDGKIVEAWESRNDGSLWQQLGAFETQEAGA